LRRPLDRLREQRRTALSGPWGHAARRRWPVVGNASRGERSKPRATHPALVTTSSNLRSSTVRPPGAWAEIGLYLQFQLDALYSDEVRIRIRISTVPHPPPSRPNRPLLLALPDGGLPTPTLHRALALAQTLDAKLHVLRVVSGRWPLSPASPQVDLLAVTRSVQYVLQSEHSLRGWLSEVLPAPWLPEDVCIRSGDFVAHAATRAAEINASLIVVPPAEPREGQVAARLACAAHVPVLVARDATFDDSIVAATDLMDPTYPVLRTAVSLGRRLDAAVIGLHNLRPLVLLTASEFAYLAPIDNRGSYARARLEHELRRLGSRSTAVIAGEADAADAILQAAQARNVDLIAVGTRPRSWLERLLRSSVAARVVNGSNRSVLVVPIDARRRASDTLRTRV
jgi:nucleotide-binding universal stress UspA family protein